MSIINKVNNAAMKEHKMKQFYKKSGVVFLMITGMSLGRAAPAEALWNPFSSLSSENIAEKVLNTLQKHGTKEFCRRGDAKKMIFSIRSFEGEAASLSETLAALGMLVCSKDSVEDFSKSKFHANAIEKLGTENLGEIKTIFVSKIKSAKGKVLALSCMAVNTGLVATGVGTAVTPAVSTACKFVH
jgi:hypothetical protein